jgi:putative SOS response-associated peptidase YedK
MCGRYSFAPNPEQLAHLFSELELLPEQLEQSFNIAPTQKAPIITNEHPKQIASMAWGLVPHGSDINKLNGKHINARSETIDQLAIFKDCLKSQRCLVLADSFYEWRKLSKHEKQAYRIKHKSGGMLVFAGLWQRSELNTGQEVETFAIITTPPNAEMKAVHNRMPALLCTTEKQKLWLSQATQAQLLPLLQPAPDAFLTLYPIHHRVGSPLANDKDLHKPVIGIKTLFD